MTAPGRFAAALAAQAGPALRRMADARLEAGLTAFVAEPWGWLADEAFGARFHAACPVPGLGPTDYLPRLIETPAGMLLAAIRFRGGDLAWPFVEVLADHVVDPAAGAVVAAAFAPFAPRAWRTWRLAPWADPWPGAVLDQAIWAGRAPELRARPRPARYEDLQVEAVDLVGSYARLEAAYAAFHADRPDLAHEVTLEDEETLAKAAAAGLLLEARVDGAWAGVVAAMPDRHLGMDGWLVVEEILDARFRGQGLGVALQRHLIERLPGDGVLWGTIHRANAASARTAAACGREVVAETWWHPISPPRGGDNCAAAGAGDRDGLRSDPHPAPSALSRPAGAGD